ncbi:hypothetical protein EYF80_054412 [Liparis tanakae]|uniref:Uncharacterized protein n=1 Tax=Liparis tanakae TaxID=230148 RepID=A0A4Z2F2P3_9TELE|nr:hypothetical protein EYF80_054412 [Liparis tanakae]
MKWHLVVKVLYRVTEADMLTSRCSQSSAERLFAPCRQKSRPPHAFSSSQSQRDRDLNDENVDIILFDRRV